MNEYYGNNSFNPNNSNSGFYGQQFVFCANCGAKLTADKKFCSNCGAPLKTNNQNNNFAPPPQAQPAPNNTYFGQQNAYNSTPAPEPVYTPQPEPVYAPQPEPVYAPQPEPVYAPQPEPAYAPQPEPVYAPQPEPVYAPQPEPVYAPQPEPQYAQYSAPQQPVRPTYNPQQNFETHYSHSVINNPIQKPAKDKAQAKKRVLSIISSSLMVIIAIIMFVMPFTSLITMKADVPVIDESIKVKFSVLDMLKFSASSFQSIDGDDIEDKMEDLYEKYEDDIEDWEDGRKLNKIGDFAKKYINITLKHEDLPKTSIFGTIGVLSILQIVISGIFLIVALCSLIPAIRGKSDVVARAPFMLFGLSSVFTLTNLYACKKFFNYLGNLMGNSTGDSVKISKSQFLTVTFVAMIIGIVAMFAIRMIYKPIKIRAKEIVKRSLAVAFAVVLLVSAFFPILTTDIKAKFDDESKESKVTGPIKSDIFFNFDLMDEYTKENYKEMNNEDTQTPIQNSFHNFNWYTKRDLKKDSGEGYAFNLSLLTSLTLISGAYEYSSYFGLGTVAITFIIFAALFMIWFNICDLITRRKTSAGAIVLIKMFTILMCLIMIAIPVVIMLISNFSADFAEIDYKVNLAYGPIVMLVASIALASVPATKKKELRE